MAPPEEVPLGCIQALSAAMFIACNFKLRWVKERADTAMVSLLVCINCMQKTAYSMDMAKELAWVATLFRAAQAAFSGVDVESGDFEVACGSVSPVSSYFIEPSRPEPLMSKMDGWSDGFAKRMMEEFPTGLELLRELLEHAAEDILCSWIARIK